MKNNYEAIIEETKIFLIAFGFDIKSVKHYDNYTSIVYENEDNTYLKPSLRNALRCILGGHLMEFYYGNGKHRVSLYHECKGLTPNTDRYSTLITSFMRVNDDNENEVFVNEGDRFVRYTR